MSWIIIKIKRVNIYKAQKIVHDTFKYYINFIKWILETKQKKMTWLAQVHSTGSKLELTPDPVLLLRTSILLLN